MDFFKEFHENLSDVIGVDKFELRPASDLCLEAVVAEDESSRARWYASFSAAGHGSATTRVARGGAKAMAADDAPNEFRLLLRDAVVSGVKEFVGLATTNVAVGYVRVPASASSTRAHRRARFDIDNGSGSADDDDDDGDGGRDRTRGGGDNSNNDGSDDGSSNDDAIELLILLDQRGYHILNDIDGRTQVVDSDNNDNDNDNNDNNDDDDDVPADTNGRRILHDFETLHALLEYHCESYRSSWASALFAKLSAIGGGGGVGGGDDGLLSIGGGGGRKRVSREMADD